MNSDYLILFHVTPESNLASIRVNGVDPKYSSGVFKRSLFVQKSKLEWSIIHVSARHHLPTDKLYIFTFDVRRSLVTRFATKGVYYSTNVIEPESWFPAMGYEIDKNYQNLVAASVNREGLSGLYGWEG